MYIQTERYICVVKLKESTYCQCLYFSSNAFARKIEKLAQASWKKVGLSPSHAYLLMLVTDNPGIQPGSITGQLQLTPSTITRLIEKLEAKKLLERRLDGKNVHVHPTRKAIAMQPELRACISHFYESYSSILGREESARLVKQMNLVADKLPP